MKSRNVLILCILITVVLSMLFGKKIIFEFEYLFPAPVGWKSYVAYALLDVNSFPENWKHSIDSPYNLYTDPEINHVYRAWGQSDGKSGSAEESIWRAYSDFQAYDFYNQLINSQIHFKNKKGDFQIDFHPPKEIDYTSKTADKDYLACGWYVDAYCDYFAKYKNYVLYLHIEREDAINNRHSDGLSYQEIEDILVRADIKMNEYLKSNLIIQ